MTQPSPIRPGLTKEQWRAFANDLLRVRYGRLGAVELVHYWDNHREGDSVLDVFLCNFSHYETDISYSAEGGHRWNELQASLERAAILMLAGKQRSAAAITFL